MMTNNNSHTVNSDESAATTDKHFFKKAQTIEVSRMNEKGWWLGNGQEHVQKGTALGSDCTTIIYTPSDPSLTARFDKENQEWIETYDRSQLSYWSPAGEHFKIGTPDGDYPEWAVKTQPPAFDLTIETILFIDGTWKKYPIQLGKKYWDSDGNELVVSDFNFELPQNHTWTEPPELKEGHGLKLVKGSWQLLEDHRDKLAFSKKRDDNDYVITELGEVPSTHTLTAPNQFDSWIQGKWRYDKKRELPVQTEIETSWRNRVLTNVNNRIDQYLKDKEMPAEFRRSPFSEADFAKLAEDRALLCDYTKATDFPFSDRPSLSGLVDE